jgi:hemin uptake protein HemP
MDLKLNVNRGTSGADGAPRAASAPLPDRHPTEIRQARGGQAPENDHAAAPGKNFCEAGPGWCRVCEKMSDIRVLRSEDLLQGQREALIIHGEQVYRLLCTRNGKLILQK